MVPIGIQVYIVMKEGFCHTAGEIRGKLLSIDPKVLGSALQWPSQPCVTAANIRVHRFEFHFLDIMHM